MKRRTVVYAETAKIDLFGLFRWLAEQASITSAVEIVDELEMFIAGLDIASERGTQRDDITPGLRIIVHGRAQIVVYVDERTITIARIFYGGQDYEAALRRPG